MKKTFRMLAALLSLLLCAGLFAACDGQTDTSGTTNAPAADPASDMSTTAGTEPYVAPADEMGLVVSADSTLITWYAYESDKETIDFMGVDVKTLGDAASDMSVYYLESDVSYYLIKDGKLVEAAIYDVVPQSVIGVTTLEEGVQEVYILYQPEIDDGSDEVDDVQEEIVDELPEDTTAATEEETPEQEKETSSEENG